MRAKITVEQRVIECMHYAFNITRKDIENTPSIADLNIDSVDLISLQFLLEEEFDVSVPDNNMFSFKTVQEIIDYIEKSICVLN